MTPHRCPVCNGTGLVSRPPWIAGDQPTWTDTSAGPYLCNACAGTGVIRVEEESEYESFNHPYPILDQGGVLMKLFCVHTSDSRQPRIYVLGLNLSDAHNGARQLLDRYSTEPHMSTREIIQIDLIASGDSNEVSASLIKWDHSMGRWERVS